MKFVRYIQVLLAYQQARKGKLTDTTLVRLLGVRTNFLTLLRKGQKTGEEVSYGGIIRTFAYCLNVEQKIISSFPPSTIEYQRAKENIENLKRGLKSMYQDAIILYNDTYPNDKNPLWIY